MNAGAYGGEMKDVLEEITVLTKEGEISTNFPGKFGPFPKNRKRPHFSASYNTVPYTGI